MIKKDFGGVLIDHSSPFLQNQMPEKDGMIAATKARSNPATRSLVDENRIGASANMLGLENFPDDSLTTTGKCSASVADVYQFKNCFSCHSAKGLKMENLIPPPP
ncbi:MAG: hypothetical protein ACREOI_23525 [bacterium]